jgi:phosphoribosyl 1,2-cyclic phosphate phosphodiesterase
MTTDTLRLTILGCGSSPGTPRINGDWGACDPAEPRNRRTRAAALFERIKPDGRVTRVVVDTGPDFRQQMLAVPHRPLAGVVYTHGHADHLHGIDDLRSYVLEQRHRINVYADAATTERMVAGFGYCFATPPGSSYPPILRPNLIRNYEAFSIDGEGGPLTFEPLPQEHGDIHSLGLRVADFAYCPDVSGFPDATAARLGGLKLLVVDALQYRGHSSHFSLCQALEQIARLKPERALLTHMHVPLDYRTVLAETPDNVEPAFDGLVAEMHLRDL